MSGWMTFRLLGCIDSGLVSLWQAISGLFKFESDYYEVSLGVIVVHVKFRLSHCSQAKSIIYRSDHNWVETYSDQLLKPKKSSSTLFEFEIYSKL